MQVKFFAPQRELNEKAATIKDVALVSGADLKKTCEIKSPNV